MQLTTAVYLLVLAAGELIAGFFLDGPAASGLWQAYLQAGMPANQAQSLAQTMNGVLLGVTVVSAVIYVFLAYAGYRGWGWSFWVAGVVLVLRAFSAFSNLSNLVNRSPSSVPLAGALVTEILSLLGLALLCWFVVSFVRYGFGSWARPKGARAGAT